jgi:hypothetical protein
MSTPSWASTSALPLGLEIPRLPCLATGTPQAATARATAVETLRRAIPLPPVPQVSIASARQGTRISASRIATTAPAITSAASPRIARPINNAPIWAGSAAPRTISRKISTAATRPIPSPWTRRARPSRIAASAAGGLDGGSCPALLMLSFHACPSRHVPSVTQIRVARKLASRSWPCSLSTDSG